MFWTCWLVNVITSEIAAETTAATAIPDRSRVAACTAGPIRASRYTRHAVAMAPADATRATARTTRVTRNRRPPILTVCSRRGGVQRVGQLPQPVHDPGPGPGHQVGVDDHHAVVPDRGQRVVPRPLLHGGHRRRGQRV